jgi:hypothetical protein
VSGSRRDLLSNPEDYMDELTLAHHILSFANNGSALSGSGASPRNRRWFHCRFR